jgi:hypothetical protein
MISRKELYPVPQDVASDHDMQELFSALQYVRRSSNRDRRILLAKDYPRLLTLARTHIRNSSECAPLWNIDQDDVAVVFQRMNRAMRTLHTGWTITSEASGYRLVPAKIMK